MNLSAKQVLLGIWIGSVVTLAVTASFLISAEDTIGNAPGEVEEVLAGIAGLLVIVLLVITLAVGLLSRMKKSKLG